MKSSLLLTFCLIPLFVSVSSCKEKGPAEKTGEKVDKALEKVEDAVDPKGPAEKAGEKVDKALGR
jgi:outer membrane lipoprotein-sorting protein